MSNYGPQKPGGTYYSGYWQKHYTVLSIVDGWIEIRWADGQEAKHLTDWTEVRDLITRMNGTVREYSVDGKIWAIGAVLARDAYNEESRRKLFEIDLNREVDEELRFQAWRGLIADRDPILDELEGL